ncbi:MAG: BON domain-containing protein [Chloroflexota bacterium]|nr:BON domain-containing protein [Chloroflexota bacterium]
MTTLRPAPTKTDKQVQMDVLAELERDYRFHPGGIGVEVDHGVVTLTGMVSTYLQLGQAANVASEVPGVKDVANKLTVTRDTTRDDTTLARAVRSALTWDADVPEERIDSIVRDRVVTLKGTVENWAQRKAAHDAVARLSGVEHVNDHIVIEPRPRGDAEIFEEIKAALHRRLPTSDVDAVVDSGRVILQGTVTSYARRYDAERLAWTTKGVRAVHNKIAVEP